MKEKNKKKEEKSKKKDEKAAPQVFVIDGTTIASGVAETIVALAVNDVEGVAAVGSTGPMSTLTSFYSGRLPHAAGIDLSIDEKMRASVSFSIQIYYGYRLADVAKKVRKAVVNALKAQLGIDVSEIDIQIDGVRAKE